MIRLLLLSVTFLLLDISSFVGYVEADKSNIKCGSVFITVSSFKRSFIELNWEIGKCIASDVQPKMVALFNKDIRNKTENHVIMYAEVLIKNYPEGFYRTNTSFNINDWPDYWKYNSTTLKVTDNDRNFPYWIVSFSRDNQIIDIQSLKLQPTWMNDNREKLKPQQIGNLLIPGTHDTGCYSGVILFQNFILTQDLPIWHQLAFGIRSLDLRIAYYQDGEFYINHDFIKVKKLDTVYRQIKEFVQRSPGEVIILDFHRFPFPSTWSQELHEQFINYTLNFLGQYAIPRNDQAGYKGPTMEEIWKTGKNLILAYGEKQYVQNHPLLWNPVEQAWANTRYVETLKEYLNDFLYSDSTQYLMFNSLMAELTPNYIDVITGDKNLRKNANSVNRNLTKWVRDVWNTKVNIVATDFFLGNNLIEVAIDVNTNR